MVIHYITLKQCNRKDNCINQLGCWLPATLEYFGKQSVNKKGLNNRCRACETKYQREWAKANPDKVRARANKYARAHKEERRQYRLDHMEEFREYCRRWRERNPEQNREIHRKHYWDNVERERKRVAEYQKTNRDQLLSRQRERYAKNPEPERERRRNYRKAHLEQERQANREYLRRHPEKNRIYMHRRKAKRLALPNNFTPEQWQTCLNYFHHCCAACGRQLVDLFGDVRASLDHWIPLSSPECPGTVASNVVPLCYGVGGCNSSKQDSDPKRWLIRRFGKRKATAILNHVQSYFDSLRETSHASAVD